MIYVIKLCFIEQWTKYNGLSQVRQVEKPYTVHYLFAGPLKVPSSSGGFPLLFN